MKPVNRNRLLELLSEAQANEESVQKYWFVNVEGEPVWSQAMPGDLPMISGMAIQPKHDGPSYRVLTFEDFPDREDLCVVRVAICESSEQDHSLEGYFPPRPPS